ncbi:MAG: hypothetical protein K0Q68_497 [Moraxellaceae bacterium]|jgi:hypothetical protein|nr:hypothetical protein [Moraxellaceae bacterium]
MNKLWKVVCVAGALALAPLAIAADVEAPVATEASEPASEAAPAEGMVVAPGVELSATGDQVVKVNSGVGVVDAAANMAIKCGERSAAFRTCEAMGGFKAMGCRKLAEMRYKEVVCPL